MALSFGASTVKAEMYQRRVDRKKKQNGCEKSILKHVSIGKYWRKKLISTKHAVLEKPCGEGSQQNVGYLDLQACSEKVEKEPVHT